MSTPQLSTGSLKQLLTAADDTNSDLWDAGYVFQILSLKKIATARDGSGADRYRLIVSDGAVYSQAMLATQLTHMIEEEKLRKNTIIKVDRLTCNSVSNKRLLIIISLSVITHAGEKIGDPTGLDPIGQGAGGDTPTTEAPKSSSNAAANTSSNFTPQRSNPIQQQSHGFSGNVFPIEALNPYQTKCVIRARVVSKSEIKHWSNPKGEGAMFSVSFMDESGEIRANAFYAQVEQFYDKLEEGRVYYVSKARVNLAKKKFANVNNDYEMILTKDTEIIECEDQIAAPQIKYNFVQLADLENVPKDSNCDVIAVVKEVGEVSEITTKATGKQLKKRELTLVDRSEYTVRMTLWGNQAEHYSAEEHAIIAFRGVRVGDFGGRSLSMSSSATMAINPDITECHALRGWYDSLNKDASFKAYSSGGGGGGGSSSFKRDEMRTLAYVREEELGSSDQGDIFSCQATVTYIKTDNIAYPACPSDKCNKKVTEGNEGWRCEKCNMSYEKPEYRYIMSLCVADHTGQTWFQGFNEVGVKVLDMTANELMDIKANNEDTFNSILAKATCQTFNFRCRAKQDTYNDTPRVRYNILGLEPLDYKKEAMILRDILKSDWAK